MSSNTEALRVAVEALEEIALAGMSGSGQESEEGMRDWHARQAWKFISIAAQALGPARAALAPPPPASMVEPTPQDVLRVARITLDGSTLIVPADSIDEVLASDNEEYVYSLTFKTMTRADFDALGEFDGF